MIDIPPIAGSMIWAQQVRSIFQCTFDVSLTSCRHNTHYPNTILYTLPLHPTFTTSIYTIHLYPTFYTTFTPYLYTLPLNPTFTPFLYTLLYLPPLTPNYFLQNPVTSVLPDSQILNQLTILMRHVEDVLGIGWEKHVEGQKLKAFSDSFKVKLDITPVFNDWVESVGLHVYNIYIMSI